MIDYALLRRYCGKYFLLIDFSKINYGSFQAICICEFTFFLYAYYFLLR